MQEIRAKSKPISLHEHTKGLLELCEKLKEIVNNPNIDYNLLDVAIFAHDLGKVSPTFQISVGNWSYTPKLPFPDIPHSIFSLLWLNKQKLIASGLLSSENDLKILLSTIAFHHWRDNFYNIIFGKDNEFKRAATQLLENSKLRSNLLKNLIEHLNSEDFKNYIEILDFDEDLSLTVREGKDLFSYVVPPYYSYFIPQRVSIDEEYKKKWIYTTGLLMRIDHFTSFIQEEEISEEIEKQFCSYLKVKQKFKDKLLEKLKESVDDKEIWQIEILERIDRKEDNIVLIAPTGSGKTEFAYLWGAESKLFFTLPLRSAVNAIYERSKTIFGEKDVGLLHSDADVYLYNQSIDEESENFRVLDLSRQLSLPVLVSTGDQIFPSALKYPGYEKLYATLGYSKLVIDEVQAYDPRAVAIIVKLIEDIVKLGGKFLLMTATLPSFVKEEIVKRVGENSFEVIDRYEEDENCGIIKKHKIEIRQADICKSVDEIIQKAEEGKRVLVILNTVKKAQKIYQDIYKEIKEKNKDIYLKLLHSQFTFNDRKRIEDELIGTSDRKGEFSNPKPIDENKGKILVATQVVEASLDIDDDILFTELAPIDSLVQRMGRVLRRVKDKESYESYLNSQEPSQPNVIICCPLSDEGTKDKLSSGYGSIYQRDLLALSLKFLCERAGLILKFTQDQNETSKKGKKDKGKDFVESLISATQDCLKKNSQSGKCITFSISENEKQKMVEDLYKVLPVNGEYLQRFYETLNILDAGYMSNKKNEALRVFREIYTVPAIPENRINDFKKFINEFVNNNKANLSYTRFKINVLSEFAVSIDIRRFISKGKSRLPDISYIAFEIEDISEEDRKKIKKWLTGVYKSTYEYDPERGISFDEDYKKNNKQSTIII